MRDDVVVCSMTSMVRTTDLANDWASGRYAEGAAIAAGLTFLDRSAPLFAGDVVTIGGRTNVGKSHAALAMLRAQAALGLQSLYVSLEDKRRRVAARVAAGYAHDNMYAAFPRSDTETLLTLMADAADDGVSVFVLDYIQLVEYVGPVTVWNKQHALQLAMSSFKDLAAARNCLLVLVSQTRRPEAGREAEIPTIFELAEASTLERVSDVILMTGNVGGRFTLELAKNKDGPVGARHTLQRDPTTGVLTEPPTGGVEEVEANGRPEADDAW